MPYEGAVVLQSGQVMTGKIYMPSFELVFLVSGEERIALPVSKIRQVRFYDPSINVNRKFEVYRYSGSGYPGLTLFETVLTGDVKVLRKPRTDKLDISGADHKAFSYYFATDEGVKNLARFNHLLFPAIQEELGEMLKIFMQEHHLDAKDEIDAIQIIKFYNGARNGHHVVAAGLR